MSVLHFWKPPECPLASMLSELFVCPVECVHKHMCTCTPHVKESWSQTCFSGMICLWVLLLFFQRRQCVQLHHVAKMSNVTRTLRLDWSQLCWATTTQLKPRGDQQGKGSDCPPILCHCEAPSGLLCLGLRPRAGEGWELLVLVQKRAVKVIRVLSLMKKVWGSWACSV